jgi:hypothetical protein
MKTYLAKQLVVDFLEEKFSDILGEEAVCWNFFLDLKQLDSH